MESFQVGSGVTKTMKITDKAFLYEHRPSFLELKSMKYNIPSVLMLLTATAPPADIEKMVAMTSSPLILKDSVDRPKTVFKAERSKYGSRPPKSVTDGKVSPGLHSISN